MRRGMAVALAAVCVLVAMWTGVCRKGRKACADDAGLLPGLFQGCKDTATNIRSGKGTVKVHYTEYSYGEEGRKVLETEETYDVAFKGDKYKICGEQLYLKNEINAAAKYPVTPGTKLPVDVACDGRRILQYDRRSGTARIGSEATAMQGMFGSQRERQVLALAPNLMSGHGIQAIGSALPQDGSMRVVGREALDGHECIVVERKYERVVGGDQKYIMTREYWVDPERGFTVPRVREWIEGGALAHRELAFEATTELRDYGNGLWGPAKHTYTQNGSDGKGGIGVDLCYETTYGTDYQLNAPVTAEDMTLKMPPQTHVRDLDAEGGSPPP